MNEARENEVESTTCPNCGESILPGQLPCDRKAAPTEPTGIRLPVRMTSQGTYAEIIDADDQTIAHARGTLFKDTFSPPEYWAEQIVTALNEYDRLKAENAKLRLELDRS